MMNQTLLQRVSSNWTITRFFYLLMGLVLCYQAFHDHEWAIAVFGIYFSSMGLFAFGCAAGNCYVDSTATATKSTENNNLDTFDYEEIKAK